MSNAAECPAQPRAALSGAAWRAARAAMVLGVLLGLVAGCNRAHYRRQADEQAFALIQEKTNHPHWDLQDYELYVDPRSRMFDPFDPDVPPMPPDDPTSHELMHEVYGMKGYPGWHYGGDTPFVENPAWQDYLPVDEHGVLKLNSRLTQQLGRLHSRAYQAELEELYLSALDVSFERFRFDSQFFAGYQLFGTWDGRDRRGGGGESRSLFAASTYATGRNPAGWTVQRSFASGGDLVAGFANALIWQFSGPNDYTGTTLLDFSLLQPVLRGAGRDRVLERLTIAERTLLANVRAMERYRGAFFVEIMTGRNAQASDGPQRRGGMLGGSGLEGFSGVGAGGFGRLATTGAGGTGGGGTTGAGAGQAGGFIGLLQSQQQIRNQEDNIARLRSNLYRLETGLRELLTTIPASQSQIPSQRLQVAQSRQALVVAEGRLINQRNQFEAQLDTYKGTLGLPPTVCIELDDPLLDQFQLIARQLQDQQVLIDGVIEEVGGTNDKILARVKEERDEQTDLVKRLLQWSAELDKQLRQLGENMQPVDRIQAAIVDESIPVIEQDLKRLRAAIPRRAAALQRLQAKYEEQKNCLCPLLPIPSIDPVVFDLERLQAVDGAMTGELERLRKKFTAYKQQLRDLQRGVDALRKDGAKLEATELFDKVRDEAVLASQTLLTDLRLDVLALELCQARVRTYTIELVPVDISAPDAMDVASQLRHDLMNARAALVDSWRLIEFNADNLESTLNIVFSGDLSNVGQNPFDLKSTTGRLRAGLQFDAPIVRLSERNTYRQSLIEYQQARRNFYNSLDGLSRGLRSIVRSVETNQFNFEVQRYAVLAAIEQIDLNEDIRVLNEALRQPTGVTAARDSVSALNDLLNAQNDFLSIWINYELQRLWLDLDMGTMQLDDSGYWLDPGPVGAEFLARVRAELGEAPDHLDDAEDAKPLPPPAQSEPDPDAAKERGAVRPEPVRTSLAEAEAKPRSKSAASPVKAAAKLAPAVSAAIEPADQPPSAAGPHSPKEARWNQLSSSDPPLLSRAKPAPSAAAALPSSVVKNEPSSSKAARALGEPTPARRTDPSSAVRMAEELPLGTGVKHPNPPPTAEVRAASEPSKLSTRPATVQIAPVGRTERGGSVAVPADQPQPVVVKPAADADAGPTVRPAVRSNAPKSPQPPKLFRPDSARRMGGFNVTKDTRED